MLKMNHEILKINVSYKEKKILTGRQVIGLPFKH